MIKIIILIVLTFQVFSDERRIRLNYNDEILLQNTTSNTVQDIFVKLHSLPGNDPAVPITIQLRQIKNTSNPLASDVLLSQTCTFVNEVCNVTFKTPVINQLNKYTIRFQESTTFHFVYVLAQTNLTTTRGRRFLNIDGNIVTNPEGATQPGFKFYFGTTGTWTFGFKIASKPAPTVSSYDFALWSVTGNNLNSYAKQSVTTPGNVSITIGAPGYYFLTFGLQVSSIDAKTKYPIVLDFNFTDHVCPSGQFFNRTLGACQACSNDVNSKGTTSVDGVCDCNDNYHWLSGLQKCEACPKKGCPKKSHVNQGSSNNIMIPTNNSQQKSSNTQNGQSTNSKTSSTTTNTPPIKSGSTTQILHNSLDNGTTKTTQDNQTSGEGNQVDNVIKIIDSFNSGNLRGKN